MDKELKQYCIYLCFTLLCEDGLNIKFYWNEKYVCFYNTETPRSAQTYKIKFKDLWNISEDTLLFNIKKKVGV